MPVSTLSDEEGRGSVNGNKGGYETLDRTYVEGQQDTLPRDQ
jgi:hypothetical protein